MVTRIQSWWSRLVWHWRLRFSKKRLYLNGTVTGYCTCFDTEPDPDYGWECPVHGWERG